MQSSLRWDFSFEIVFSQKPPCHQFDQTRRNYWSHRNPQTNPRFTLKINFKSMYPTMSFLKNSAKFLRARPQTFWLLPILCCWLSLGSYRACPGSAHCPLYLHSFDALLHSRWSLRVFSRPRGRLVPGWCSCRRRSGRGFPRTHLHAPFPVGLRFCLPTALLGPVAFVILMTALPALRAPSGDLPRVCTQGFNSFRWQSIWLKRNYFLKSCCVRTKKICLDYDWDNRLLSANTPEPCCQRFLPFAVSGGRHTGLWMV